MSDEPSGTPGEPMSTEKAAEAGIALFGGGSHIRRWGVVCYGVADGVCSVDEQGCGYCRSECRLPKQRAARPS